MENHHFQWENPLKIVIFNSNVKLPEFKFRWLSMISDGIDNHDNLTWCQWDWVLNDEIFTEVWTIIQVLGGIFRHPYFTPFPQAWGKQSNPQKPRICRASLSSNLSNLCPPQKCSLVATCPAGTEWKSPIARVFFATIAPNLKTNFPISHDIWINDKDWQVLSFWDVYPNASTIIPVMDLHLMKSMQSPCNIPSCNIQPFRSFSQLETSIDRWIFQLAMFDYQRS